MVVVLREADVLLGVVGRDDVLLGAAVSVTVRSETMTVWVAVACGLEPDEHPAREISTAQGTRIMCGSGMEHLRVVACVSPRYWGAACPRGLFSELLEDRPAQGVQADAADVE